MVIKSSSKVYAHIIKHFGIEAILRPKIVRQLDDETSEETWGEDRLVRGHLTQITGYVDIFGLFGYVAQADFLFNVTPDTQINIGDMIKVEEDWCEVTEILKRRTGSNVDVKECLLRKKS